MKNSANRSCCTDAGGVWSNGCKEGGTGQYSRDAYDTCAAEANVTPKYATAS